MKFHKILLPILILSPLLLACNSGSSPERTYIPTDVVQIQPSPTIPPGIPFSNGNISLVIPEGLATGETAMTSIDVEYPYINPSWGDMPSHTVITLDGYNLPETARSARILVFKADEYAGYTPKTGETIAVLENLPLDAGQPYPDVLTSTFYAQSAAINSPNIHGIRYLTQVMDSFVPITNDSLFYYFQGLTNDGVWYVEAILPVNAAFLPSNGNLDAILPPEGIEFPFDQMESIEIRNGYYEAVKSRINATALTNFSPSLTRMDELVRSITLQP